MKLYARGQKVADLTAVSENIGKEQAVTIPAECIKDGILPIRIVFPNAVTPHQLDATDPDTRVLSVEFESMEVGQ